MDTDTTQTITKYLCDKSADKRKQATKEIDKLIKTLLSNKNPGQIKKFLDVIQNELLNSANPANRKGGLLGYAAIAIALAGEQKMSIDYLPYLIPPILSCMKDNDSKIRFQACESLYNIVKAMREISLLQFNEVFENLTRLVADLDEEVRKSAHVLDRMLKEVVNEAAAANTKFFNLSKFINHLCGTIKAQNPLIRKFLISWITVLESIPNINILQSLPLFLEQLFLMLGDSTKDIRESADACLMDFLKEIKETPKERTVTLDNQILNILVQLCSSKIANLTKLTALCWLHDYLKLFLHEMDDQNMSGGMTSMAQIHLEKEIKEIKEIVNENGSMAKKDGDNGIENVNSALSAKLSEILKAVLICLSDDEENIKRAASQINRILHQIVQKSNGANLEFKGIINTLKDMLHNNKATTTEAALIWMKQLINMFSDHVMPLLEDIIQRVIEKLQDSEEIIVQNAVDLLGTLSLFENNFKAIISKILNVFHNEEYILHNKSFTILKKLSSIIEAGKVFTTFAEQLLHYTDTKFISAVVQKLDILLLTDKDLHVLRKKLTNLMYEEEDSEINYRFFETLYKTWSFNPVSTVLLCLLTQQYELAYHIIIKFGNLDIELDTLVQVAKVVQLLESPIFVYLRLQLLEAEEHPYLIKSLYGLLMVLPQGKAFNVLKQRLKQIRIDKSELGRSEMLFDKKKAQRTFDVKQMLEIFDSHQKQAMEEKTQSRKIKDPNTSITKSQLKKKDSSSHLLPNSLEKLDKTGRNSVEIVKNGTFDEIKEF
jgi:vacuole morphology and inheritance protein 14